MSTGGRLLNPDYRDMVADALTLEKLREKKNG